MALAPFQLLARITAAPARVGCFDGLGVQHARRELRLASLLLMVEHQRDVVDGGKQRPAHEAAEPPSHRLPRAKMHGQRAPATARARPMADRIQHLVQAHPRVPAARGLFRAELFRNVKVKPPKRCDTHER